MTAVFEDRSLLQQDLDIDATDLMQRRGRSRQHGVQLPAQADHTEECQSFRIIQVRLPSGLGPGTSVHSLSTFKICMQCGHKEPCHGKVKNLPRMLSHGLLITVTCATAM